MGFPMASNIRRHLPASTPLYIFDLNTTACERFVREHQSLGPVVIAQSARAVAAHARTIVSIVTAAPHVRAVYLDGEKGVIAAENDGNGQGEKVERLMLECSTIDVETTRDVGAALAAAGQGVYIDAPVSGGVPGAAAGNLSFLIGAPSDAAVRPRVDAVVGMMGDPAKVFYLGGLGNGLAAKLANNYCSCIINLVTSEALNFGIRAGLDKRDLVSVIRASTGNSFMLEKVCPVPGVDPEAPSSRDYEGGFKMVMMPKDVRLAVEAAERLGARAATGRAALQVYEEAARDERIREKDASSVYRFLRGPE